MMQLSGTLIFDPPEVTKKHEKQGGWKKVALVSFKDDYDAMWRWYMKKAHGLILNPPLRSSHITVVNDKIPVKSLWEEVKREFNGNPCSICVSNRIKSNGEHWWLMLDSPPLFKEIRDRLGLGEPYYPFHYTIGLANERNIQQSKYIKKVYEFQNVRSRSL